MALGQLKLIWESLGIKLNVIISSQHHGWGCVFSSHGDWHIPGDWQIIFPSVKDFKRINWSTNASNKHIIFFTTFIISSLILFLFSYLRNNSFLPNWNIISMKIGSHELHNSSLQMLFMNVFSHSKLSSHKWSHHAVQPSR